MLDGNLPLNPDYRDIVEVREFSSAELSKMNRLLSSGWVLLGVHQEASFYHEGSDYSRTNYIIGKPRKDSSTNSDLASGN